MPEVTKVPILIDVADIIRLGLSELRYADDKYSDDPMLEPMVGFKTIECELKELERELSRSVLDCAQIEKESIQCLAMCIKFIRDIVHPLVDKRR